MVCISIVILGHRLSEYCALETELPGFTNLSLSAPWIELSITSCDSVIVNSIQEVDYTMLFNSI